MISYELAKQLKDAGFPQKNIGDCIHSKVWDISCDCGEKGETAYFPTLSELIEICGDRFIGVNRLPIQNRVNDWPFDKEWHASCKGMVDIPEMNIHCYGSTPEEAVALLYLELNKK